jgi:hypothetical protein
MTRRAIAKRPPPIVTKRGPGPRECVVCKAKPPEGPLPFGWLVGLERSAEYEKGYWLPMWCPEHKGET